MQIFAFEKNRLIGAYGAEKRKDYHCPECGGIVRLRSSSNQNPHFFHIKKSFNCRQAQKGEIHLKIQKHLKEILPGAQMEKTFPTISRIADIAHLPTKRIYEVQYSPMTLSEAKQRCKDYEGLGFQIIWLLHDHTFNKRRITPAEQFLRTKTCYYTNMNNSGEGIIYDELLSFGKRPIDLKKGCLVPSFPWPPPLLQRSKSWPLYHEGDFFDLALKKQLIEPKKPPHLLRTLRNAYRSTLQKLLDSSDR